MFGPRLLAACLGVLVLASGAQAQTSAVAAPRALHGFLLRADEGLTTTFNRTPAFAWNPVPGAARYQFQLATSSSFRENAILYSANSLTSPVVAPQVTLPWIDDMLHARVRAILRNTTTPWSAKFAFDMNPPAAPTPLPSRDGMLRWSPVEGADAYQVWLVDIPRLRITTSYTNVLDEREFYTFHRAPAWTQTVHWRIRALRRNIGATQNGLPAVSYGPWSPVYVSTNGAYPNAASTIKLVGTLSDTFAPAGGNGGPDHRLMPGFLWSGDQTIDGQSAELFRVYVFTDQGCLNRVFTGAVVGGPAYAPRPFGPLQLPQDDAGITQARSAYLSEGAEPPGLALDGQSIVANESLPPATPTMAVPTDSDSAAGAPAPTAPAVTPSTPTTGASSGSAPVDIWDTEPFGGYWWTVVAVEASAPGALRSNVGAAGANPGDTAIPVVNANNFDPGDVISIGSGTSLESVVVKSVGSSSLTLDTKLKNGHGARELVLRTGGTFRYHDLELAQDVCASGRVARFTKNSEPALTAAGEAFASGLSSGGKLVAASRNSPFYGNPLVSWTPALGADVYQVQWSKTRDPFKPELANGAAGILAWGTSAVLPLTPRTWYYRVRGFDYSLPTNAQQMSWSDPSKIVVAKPKFKIVGGGK